MLAVSLALVFLIAGVFVYSRPKDNFEENKTTEKDVSKPVANKQVDKNNQNSSGNNVDANSDNPTMEKYEAKLFVEAKWGKGKGEVGLSNPSEQGAEDAGPNYGPQSFDIADNGHLFLLDSVNERVIEYDENGKYIKDFTIACGGTGDIRVSPDQKNLYIFSWRCGAVYYYDLSGKLLDTYKLSKEILAGKLGAEGLEFDEYGNVMLEVEIKKFIEGERFYQVGNADEWKKNNYIGHLLSSNNYILDHWVDWNTENVEIVEKNGNKINEFEVYNPEENSKMYAYYSGADGKKNIYFRIGLEFANKVNSVKKYDNLFLKYNFDGKQIAVIKVLEPLTINQRKNYFYTDYFKSRRISNKGDIYYVFFFKDEGVTIYKYYKTN